MADREFHGVIRNLWNSPLDWEDDKCDGGEWQDPWYPSKPSGAGKIEPGEEKEWRSESSGVFTGTSGWALWSVLVLENHREYIQINWSIPFLGKPDITCGVFRSDPRDPFKDTTPPVLDVRAVSISEDGNQTVLGEAGSIAPYILTIPVSFFFDVTYTVHPRVVFEVRSRTAASPLVAFPPAEGHPDPTLEVMQEFRNLTMNATRLAFLGGFPTFQQSVQDLDHFGGAVFVKRGHGSWRDLPWVDLGKPALNDFAARMRQTHEYAVHHGLVGGFPTFFHADYGKGIVCGTVLLSADEAEWREVPLKALGLASVDDVAALFRATHNYATQHGFVGGFPNMYHLEKFVFPENPHDHPGAATVCGTILLKSSAAEWRSILLWRDPR